MDESDTSHPSFSRGRRWTSALNMALAAAAALALVVMVNYLAAGHFQRGFWSRDSSFKLSRQTLAVLNTLTNQVKVTIFFQPNGDNQQIYLLTSALLAEYQNACPRHIHVRLLDYSRFAGEAKELLAKYDLSGPNKEKDFVLFESNGHSRIVYAREMADYDFSDLLAGRSKFVRRSAFRGEPLFTSDIFAVSNPQALKTYFLYGHGENNPGDPAGETQDLGRSGYSKFASILKKEINCDWDRLSLLGTNGIPSDCQLLVVAGPRHGEFLKDEVAKIGDYLQKRGGRLLALLTTNCGLEPLLAQHWGVSLGDGRVMDLDPHYKYSSYTFFTATLFPHAIVNPLAKDNIPILMVWPRPVFQVPDQNKVPGAPEVTLLAATSKDGVDTARRTGVFPLLIAVEQGVIQGVDSPRGAGTRIVVAGDSDFLDDEVIDTLEGNHDFAKLAVSWLLQRPQLVLDGLLPQPIREYKLYMTDARISIVRWLFLAGMPGAVLALGGLVWLRRRH
jgi:hypothetical protein